MKHILPAIIFLLCIVHHSNGQSLDLAEEYYSKGDYDKARTYYEKYFDNNDYTGKPYQHYVEVLVGLEAYKDAEKLLKKLIRKNEDNDVYIVDYARVLKSSGNTSEFNEVVENHFDDIQHDEFHVKKVAALYYKNGLSDQAIALYKQARKASRDDAKFAHELSRVYRFTGQKDKMIDELLVFLEDQPDQLKEVQNILQMEFTEPSDFESLTSKVYPKVAKSNTLVFNRLLVWLYVQQRDFRNAFVQEKAIDKKTKERGKGLIELADLATENNAFEQALIIYEYVTSNYPNEYHYISTKRKAIAVREEMVKRSYPVDTGKVRGIIKDYDELLSMTRDPNEQARMLKEVAGLYAFYLDRVDSAKTILEDITSNSRVKNSLLGEVKIDLADIYVLEERYWKAILLYMQVEKDNDGEKLGHQAKLKVARVYFYQGDFELAKSNLDILKEATTREIANDAMELSLLIQDNLELDTSAHALQAYAAIELQIYQRKYDEAENKLNEMLSTYDQHSLTDEIYWQLAQVHINQSHYTKAISYLDKIIQDYKEDILADDAMFTKGTLLEERVDDRTAAMEVYKNLMIDFRGSIYVSKARKRYRSLRGDDIKP